jgi:hypothetical protein
MESEAHIMATNSKQYWTRFDRAETCFESESNIVDLVYILDVPATVQAPLDQSNGLRQYSTLETLTDYLENPTNLTYKHRLMYVPNTATNMRV